MIDQLPPAEITHRRHDQASVEPSLTHRCATGAVTRQPIVRAPALAGPGQHTKGARLKQNERRHAVRRSSRLAAPLQTATPRAWGYRTYSAPVSKGASRHLSGRRSTHDNGDSRIPRPTSARKPGANDSAPAPRTTKGVPTGTPSTGRARIGFGEGKSRVPGERARGPPGSVDAPPGCLSHFHRPN